MKVVELVKSLGQDELKRFNKFINSPYFNENNDLNQLLNLFIDKVLGTENLREKKEKFKSTYQWSDIKFRKCSNDLLELLLEFNTIELRRLNNFKNRIEYYNSIQAKKWSKHLKYKKQYVESFKVEKLSWSEIDLAYYYTFLKSLIDSTDLTPDQSLYVYAEIAQTRKEFIRLSDLSSAIDLANFEHANYSLELKHYRALRGFNNYLLKAYQLVSKIFEKKIDSNSSEIILKLNSLLPFIEKKYASKILDQITSYLVTQINKGDLSVSKVIFDIYRMGLNLDIIEVHIGIYRNISYFACQQGQFEWALKFLDDYKNKLPVQEQESAYSFTKARTLWYAKDWEGVIRTLRNVEYKDMTYNLLARSYILTCYYELDDYEPLDSLIKSFKVYLRRKRNVSKARKESFYNFITALDHLMKASERNDHRRIQKAKDLIQENPSTRNKDWLNEKIEELEAVIKPSKK